MMNRRQFLTSSAAVSGAFILGTTSVAQSSALSLPLGAADGWVSLLNGHDLTGWYSMLEKSGKGVAERRRMVTMEEGMLHIMGNEEGVEPAEAGYLATTREFQNVHIRVEYKWGVKRFAPRSLAKRDNGLLYGLVGADKVWPTCVECQIQEGDVGDYFMVGTRGIQDEHDAGLFGEALTQNGWSKPAVRRTPEPPAPVPGQFNVADIRKVKDGNFEILDGWNVVEVIWQGDRSAHIVNGRTVNSSSKLQQPDPTNAGAFVPLKRGKIAIEIEFSEIWFRRIEVRSLA